MDHIVIIITYQRQLFFKFLRIIEMSRYSLENLWNFSDTQIHQILRYFNNSLLNNPNDRLNAVILSFNNNLLVPEERKYVSSPYFNQLFLTSDEQLRALAQQYGLTQPLTHVGLIKYIIDHVTPITPSVPAPPSATAPSYPSVNIPIVTAIPSEISQPIALYQMDNNIYICGRGTYPIREQLKNLNGIWNPGYRCWSFPLNRRQELIQLASPISQPSPQPTPQVTIPSNIPTISIIPKRHTGGLQIYQMNGQVLVCGSRTNGLHTRLREIEGNFNRDINCWMFPPQRANDVINLVNTVREEDIIHHQETAIRSQQEAQAESALLARLQQSEQESPYIPHINKLPLEIVEQARANGTFDTFRREMDVLDAEELRREWGNKIRIMKWSAPVRSRKEAIVTYDGNVKPPDLALVLSIDNWSPGNFGWTVQRIDYKTYRVTVFTD
jgi:hypothetical protein